jgi:hypothetical protein
VFTPDRSGFDAVIGNPPWDTIQPESLEFFSEFDPLYRTYGTQVALRRQRELFGSRPQIEEQWHDYCELIGATTHWTKECADPFDVPLDQPANSRLLHQGWSAARNRRQSQPNSGTLYQLQGRGKTFTYKLFLELGYTLTTPTGRLGMIVPSGVYSDAGSKLIRNAFLRAGTWEWLFVFRNRKYIFQIDSTEKFGPVVVDRRATEGAKIRVAFLVEDMADWEAPVPLVFHLDQAAVSLFSPESGAIPEIRHPTDFAICERVYRNSVRVGDKSEGWHIEYAQEFNTTSDSKHFPPRPEWEAKGFSRDDFGRWIGPAGELALPVFQGGMIHQFDPLYQEWAGGAGKSIRWRELPAGNKQPGPSALMSETYFRANSPLNDSIRVAYRRIGPTKNERSMICTPFPPLPTADSIFTLFLPKSEWLRTFPLAAALNSLVFDFVLRQRLGGKNLSWFLVRECPIPFSDPAADIRRVESLAVRCSKLSLTHRLHAPLWLRLRDRFPHFGDVP